MAPDGFPALKPKEVLKILRRLGYVQVAQEGSHRKLDAPGRARITFAFHDRREVPPAALRRMLVKNAGLTADEARDAIRGR